LVKYRIDDQGTLFVVQWNNPFLGGNDCDCHVEGTHADFYVVDRVCGGGNTGAQMRFMLGALVAGSERQTDWRFCGKCMELFFNGTEDKGTCPAGGFHDAIGLTFSLPHDTPARRINQTGGSVTSVGRCTSQDRAKQIPVQELGEVSTLPLASISD
jgi:hypothetical protein